MVSVSFIYFFIPVFMAVYVAFSSKHRKLLLIAGTIIMTASACIYGLIPLGVSVFTGYFGGIFINRYDKNKNKSRIFFVISVIVNLSVFLLFSYSRYFGTGFVQMFLGKGSFFRVLPVLGASVYTLHSISYCADIYFGKYKCDKSFLTVFSYIGFFPVLTAGPLVRFDEMRESLVKPELTSEKASEGIKLFLIGLLEKLALSDNMFELWENVSKMNVSEISLFTAWIGIIAFSLCFFYEFSAFAHIGRGFSLIMGIDIPRNFNQPFTSKSISEFLQKFNRTLYRFCLDYIYFPLAKNKNRKKFFVIPVLITMISGSLWYGFGKGILLWSLFLFVVIVFEKATKKVLDHIPHLIRCVVMNVAYLVGLPLLAIPQTGKALSYIGAMFGINSFSGDVLPLYLIKNYIPVLLICLFFITDMGNFFKKKINSVNENILAVVQPVCEIAFLIIATAFLISGTSEQFAFLF